MRQSTDDIEFSVLSSSTSPWSIIPKIEDASTSFEKRIVSQSIKIIASPRCNIIKRQRTI